MHQLVSGVPAPLYFLPEAVFMRISHAVAVYVLYVPCQRQLQPRSHF
jgi:ABC-type uncharacterized transport system permease subunit